MKKEVYLAAPSAEVDRAWSMREAIREAGHDCLCTWIDLVLEAREQGHTSDATIDEYTLRKNAASDRKEVRRASHFVYVRGDGVKSEGAATEFGMFIDGHAGGRDKAVVFDSTDKPPSNIFSLLVKRVRNMDELLAWLAEP